MARAQAVVSPSVSPRIRMAVRAAAAWVGVGSPRRQAAKNSPASSSESVPPSARRESSGLKASDMQGGSDLGQALDARKVEEVAQQLVAAFGRDGFRVELNAVDRPRLVLDAHDLAVLGPSRDLQNLRQMVRFDGKAVVAGGRERGFQPREDTRVRVMDETGFPMHEGAGANDFAAKRLADRLMAEADAEDWQGFRRMADESEADPGFIWRTRPGRQQDGLRPQAQRLIDGDRIIAMDNRLRPQLVEIVDEVVGEAVVVIDHQDHDGSIGFAATRAKRDAGGMSRTDSALDASQVARARALLKTPERHDPMWPALVAATALAVTSVVFATVMVLAPPLQ